MSKYNPEYHRNWYKKNRDRLLLIRKEYNKKHSESIEGKESDKIRNQLSKRKAYRKQYKKTEAGKISNLKYRRKPEVKQRYEEYRLKVRYGITTAEYWNLVAEQKGVCAICGKSDGKKLHIDHDHKTNKVRGLLCGNCNKGLGLFKDDVSLLDKAIKYLDGQIYKNDSIR